jgi:hypothetical protein
MADEDQLKRLDELNKKDSAGKKTELTPEEEAALLEAELIFVKKWGGVALIGKSYFQLKFILFFNYFTSCKVHSFLRYLQ